MVTIKYGKSSATISEKSGILASVVFDGKEYLWQGDEKSWKSQDIVIFPFIARLNDGWYEVKGEHFEMKPHGLARYSTFAVTKNTADSATLRLKWSSETLAQYPYKFVFTVKYTISDRALKISYNVKNEDEKIMPFGLGTHFAWQLDGEEDDKSADTSGNFILFEKTPDGEYVFDDEKHLVSGERKWTKGDRLELCKGTFIHDAVVTKNMSQSVILKKRGGEELRFDIGDVPVLAIWSKVPFGKFACVEAWWGLPDYADCRRELIEKPLINKIESGKQFNYEVNISLK